MQYVRDIFAPIKKIIGVTAIDNSADSVAIKGQPITVQCVSGNLWINPLATAVADATSFKMTDGLSLELVVLENLSLISDATGASYQIIFWDM